MRTTAEQRRASGVDHINHSGVQPWSAGPIFPAVIAVVERYEDFMSYPGAMFYKQRPVKSFAEGERAFYEQPLADRLKSVSYELILGSHSAEYASREDAEQVARALIADPQLQAKWGKGGKRTNLSKNPRFDQPGVINHEFINASDAPGQYEAEQCGRQAVTAKWLFDHPDADGYAYSLSLADMGCDPWREIAGVDALVDGSEIILEFGRTDERRVHPNQPVFVSLKHLTQ